MLSSALKVMRSAPSRTSPAASIAAWLALAARTLASSMAVRAWVVVDESRARSASRRPASFTRRSISGFNPCRPCSSGPPATASRSWSAARAAAPISSPRSTPKTGRASAPDAASMRLRRSASRGARTRARRYQANPNSAAVSSDSAAMALAWPQTRTSASWISGVSGAPDAICASASPSDTDRTSATKTMEIAVVAKSETKAAATIRRLSLSMGNRPFVINERTPH